MNHNCEVNYLHESGKEQKQRGEREKREKEKRRRKKQTDKFPMYSGPQQQ